MDGDGVQGSFSLRAICRKSFSASLMSSMVSFAGLD
jgi:hypothetical protein